MNLELGDVDLVTVACAAAVNLFSGIQIDGKALPFEIGQIIPEDVRNLPIGLVHCPNADLDQLTGRRGQRAEKIDLTMTVQLVFADIFTQLSELSIKMGKARAQVLRRLADNTSLEVDGKPFATDLRCRSIQTGFADDEGSATLFVSILTLSCTIHHREGVSERTFASAHV